jgi:Tfp pilus assembly protein PilF
VNARLSCVALVALALAAGCAKSGATPGAETPGKAPPGAEKTGASGADSGMGISDAPTSGEMLTERPKMNAAAAAAYEAGTQAFKAGDLPGARAQFTKATEADPKAFQAFYSLGVVLERQGQSANAVTAYRKATLIVPDYEPAIYAYAVALARENRGDEALEYLNGRGNSMPKSAAIPAAMAEVKSIQGDSGQAQKLAQEALKKNPDYAPAMITLARDHYRARRLDLALYTLRAILDGYGPENPPRGTNNAEARLLRGLIYKEQGLRGPAIDEFQKALAIRSDLVEARVQLATYMLESGNAVEAAPLLEGAIRYDNDHLLAHLNLGDAYRLLGKTDQAKREFEWVHKTDPQLAQVHYNLGLLYLFSQSVPGVTPLDATTKAITEFEEYKKKRPRQAGKSDDTDELITRAKAKKALIEAAAADAAAAQAAPPAAAAPAEGAAAPPLQGGK